MDPRFAHVTDWIFDLDNCLYPASTGLFELIDERMGAFIQRLLDCDPVEAKRVQKAHFHAHGTTLAGLMREHRVDPHEFLEDVHAIPLDRMSTGRPAGSKSRPPAGAQADLHQRRRALCPPGARRARRRRAFRRNARHSRRRAAAQARRAWLSVAAGPVRHRSRARGDGRGHGAEPQTREKAGDDHGVGRQWLRTRQSRPPSRLYRPHHRRRRRMAGRDAWRRTE